MKPSETTERKKQRALQIVQLLGRYYKDAKCSLDYRNPFELLVATVLSAQCTDERVNKVTPKLFEVCPSPKELSQIKVEELENLIRSTGFYKNKAKNLKACAVILYERYKSQIPKSMEELSDLPGVGRKTANVVLGNAFGIPGMVVDTHVTRISNQLGLVRTDRAEKIESELMELIPKEHWVQFSHWLISHGRGTCKARKPDCEHCFMAELCPKTLVTTKVRSPKSKK